jgi:hypothetical protein
MSIRLKVGFVGVLACLMLVLGLFSSTGVASAHSTQAVHSQTSVSTLTDNWGGPGGDWWYPGYYGGWGHHGYYGGWGHYGGWYHGGWHHGGWHHGWRHHGGWYPGYYYGY